MKKTIKYLLIISIITIIYIFGNYINSYGEFISAETYIRNNSQGWWCVEHGPDAANTDYEKSGPYYYTSDSTSEFERAFAYIVKNGHETGDAGYGIQDNGSHLGGGKHQLALWKLLYDFRGSNGLGTIAPFKNIQATKNVDINNPRNIGVIGVKELYDTARNQQPIAYSNNSEGAIIETGPLKMKQDTNKGSLEINNLVGNVSNIYIKWSDNTVANLTLNAEEKYYVPNCFGIYTNSECTTPLNIQSIKEGTIYLKNYRRNYDITDCKITVTSNSNGYRVGFYLYHNNYNQDMIQTFWEKGQPSSNTINVGVKYYGEMTIRKIDYDDNTLIDNSEFVIFEKDKGWIGYNSNNITTGNSWSNAYRFKTGTSYCGEKAYTGEFTLKKLPNGYYYIFEVSTGSNLYSLKGQPGYSSNSNYSFFNNDKWKMNGIESVLIGRNSCANGFTKVGLADGTPYSFYPWKNVDKNKTTDTVCDYVRLSECNSSFKYSDKYYYATNHATVTIKNRKNTKLTIIKKDKDTNTPIANVGIKVLVKTTETRFTLNSYKWIKKDGTVTANANEADEFKTNNNGKVEILNVPYGKYYIFETSTADDNYKLELQDHFMEGKPEDYKGTFLSEQYVYLGSKTIAPNTNNDLNNNKYTSNVIENGWYRIRSNLNKNYFIRPAYYGTGNNIKMTTNLYDSNYDWFNYRISYVNQGNYIIARKYTMGSNSDDSSELYRPISIDRAKISNNQNVEQYEYVGSDAQLWKFSRINNTTNQYNIVSKMNTGYGLHINALTPSNGTKIDIYNIQEANGKASKGSTLKFNLVTDAKFGVYDVNGTREITVEATNSKNENKGKLTIIKKDGSYSKDFNVNETLRLKGAEIKIYATNLAKEGTDKGWVQEIRNDNGNIEYIYSSYENATTFKIGDTGNIELNGLFNGNYYIYETKTPTGYPIKEQPGYHNKNEGSSDLGDIDWVFLGNTKLDDQNNDVIYEVENIWYTSLKGKVWRDVPAYKDTTVGDNVYRSNVDELMDGINVNLYNGKDELIAKTTTNNNGEYEFRYKGEQNKTEEQIKDEDKLTYWELASCYVEFIYDNKDYVVVNQFIGEDKTINSKAIEETMIQQSDEIDELKDEKLSGTDTEKNLPGRAVTYKGGRNLTSNEIIENTNDNNKNLATTPLTGYYNKDTYTIEDINLGLVKKPNQELYVGENLKYIKITLNGYTYTYKYGDPEVLNSQFVPTVEKQKNKFDFYAKLYPTDVAYDATKDTEELKVYAVYSIGVENPTITQEYDTYYEKKLYLSELNATYDTDRFELSKDEIGDAEENKQFKLWRGGNGQAYFDLNETEERGNVFKNGIEPNIQKEPNQPSKIKITHIQFKVKKEIIKQILSDINSVNNTEVPTKVFAKGYHEYLRTDNVWIDNKNVKAYRGVKETYNDETNKKFYVHKSTEVKDESCGLYLKFALGEARTISGLVFEDKDEQLNDYERIGNGKYDDGETKLKNVRVSLLNESGNVVKLYNKENNSTTIKDAIDISEDGTYKLAGVLPGKYYLQFTYGNGTKVYKDINGNEIDGKAIATTKLNGENINTKLYKSTILTGNAKGEKNLKEEDDKDSWYQTWFINDIDKNNSVATDIDETINSRINAKNLNTELNYQYVNEGNISEIIDAKSPKIDIKIENTDKEESKYNELPPINCSGLSFGIIERPHVNITLEKKIKNIQLTLQNGTTIINGDPADKSVSQSVAKLTDSNARLELDPSYLYGSNAIVTYTLSAHNESELDYATEDYYKYGDKKDATPVTTTVTKIVDYLNNKNASYENQSNNVNEVELKEDEKNKYFSQGVISENTDYKQKVFTTDKALKPVAAVTEEHLDETCTDEYEFTVNNLLSTSDESLGWISYAEIIGMKNITVTPQSVSKSGNYVVGNIDTYEADTAIATISISPSTGENKNLIIYATIGGGLIIIALGVVLIKRFVINGK